MVGTVKCWIWARGPRIVQQGLAFLFRVHLDLPQMCGTYKIELSVLTASLLHLHILRLPGQFHCVSLFQSSQCRRT